MAIEVAKLMATDSVIVIASAKTQREIPPYYRLAGKLRLHKLLPANLLTWPNVLTDWFFGVQSQADKALLAAILQDTNGQFLTWAIDKIVTWTNLTQPQHLKHIHGTKDRLLPFRFVVSDVAVSGGGHFMTVNKADELIQAIRRFL